MYSVQMILGIATVLIQSAMFIIDRFEIEAPRIKSFLKALSMLVTISKFIFRH